MANLGAMPPSVRALPIMIVLLVTGALASDDYVDAAGARHSVPRAPSGTIYDLRTRSEETAPVELEATVVPFPNAVAEEVEYPTLDPRTRRAAPARWRVVSGTGNCCENYLAATPEGRIYDFGSTYLVFSDDRGQSWSQVRPQRTAAATGGEGTVVLAPNGDVVGVTWIPYGGDRIETFKYDAQKDKWFYSYAALRHPFYDRESVAVIPGPIQHLGEEYPYMVVMRGGWPTKNPWYYSFDGLNYLWADHRTIDSATRPPVREWLDVARSRSLDWIQPAIQTTVTPLGRARALALPDPYQLGSDRVDVFDPDELQWSPFELPKGELVAGLASKLVADSTGRLHYVYMTRAKAFYMVSTNGGRSWSKQLVPMPFKGARTWSRDGVEEQSENPDPPDPRFEFVANGRLGIMALSIQIHDPEQNLHTNYVYKYQLDDDTARLLKIYQVGDGDLEFGNNVLASGARMDFQSIALLPDGRIVVSFGDKRHSSPAVAIEQ